ncbi:MAG: sodium:solute symporter [Lewinella sp.]|nr:sodium:solute symporter [Lewinella sp.]
MNWLDYLIIAVYAAGMLGLGYLFKSQKDGQDYFLGGKSLGWFALGLSIMATQLSAISFVSAPAFVGVKPGGGMQWLSYEFAVPLAMIFLLGILVPPLYKAGVVSIYAYLERRFDRSSRLLLSAVFLISRAFATGIMVYTISIILESVMGIPFWTSLAVIGVVTLIYSLQGGMKAVVYGDMIQMIILFGGIVICLIYGLDLIGGWDAFLANVDTSRVNAVNFAPLGIKHDGDFGFWPMVLGGFFLYVSYYGTDQSQAQRTLSARNLRTVRQTLLFNGLIRFPITLAYCLMGLILGTLMLQTPDFAAQVPASDPDRMVPVFIATYLPNGVIGLLIVAILSAAMSSLSSAINSLSAVTVEDFMLPLFKFSSAGNSSSEEGESSNSNYLLYSRWASFFWGIICLLLAVFAGNIADTVIEAINKVGSVFYGPILATFLLAMATRRTHARGVNIGIIAGVALNIYLWLGVGDELFWFWWNVTGFLTTFLVGYLTSLALPGRAKEVSLDFTVDWKNLFNREALILVVWFIIIVVFSVNLPNWLS